MIAEAVRERTSYTSPPFRTQHNAPEGLFGSLP
jgi:hypothetical protein